MNKKIKTNKKSKRFKAFTLIEAAIVLFIISLLMLLILPNLNQQRKIAEEKHAEAMVSTIQTQVELYHNETDADNVSLNDLLGAGYLTQKQVDKAEKLGISINGLEATK